MGRFWWEDQEFPVRYPCPLLPGDKIKLKDGTAERTADRAITLRNENDLKKFLEEGRT